MRDIRKGKRKHKVSSSNIIFFSLYYVEHAAAIGPHDVELNVRNLTRALQDVTDWETLGVQLGVNPSKIGEIARNHHYRDLHLCKMDLLVHWLQSDGAVSWERMASALDDMNVHNVAENIRMTYCIPEI